MASNNISFKVSITSRFLGQAKINLKFPYKGKVKVELSNKKKNKGQPKPPNTVKVQKWRRIPDIKESLRVFNPVGLIQPMMAIQQGFTLQEGERACAKAQT